MKNISLAIAFCLFASVLAAEVCRSGDVFFYITREEHRPDLIRVIGGVKIKRSFHEEVKRIGQIEDINKYKFPLRFSSSVTIADLLETRRVIYNAGITNLVLQLIDKPHPTFELNPVIKSAIVIHDCLNETHPDQSPVGANSEYKRSADDEK